jgi:hypothetical protein
MIPVDNLEERMENILRRVTFPAFPNSGNIIARVGWETLFEFRLGHLKRGVIIQFGWAIR